MVPTATNTVQGLLGADFGKCESPSLRLEKFVVLEDKDRKKVEIERVCSCGNRHAKAPACRFVLPGAQSLIMKLQSRLIVNQAGGILENAGLCLHPHLGCPMIPGSAVKGVARAAAIQAILAAESAPVKTDLLIKTALVFGWCEQDWSTDRKRDKKMKQEGTFKSDYRYACDGDGWQKVWTVAAERLLAILQVPEKRIDPKKPVWQSLPNFAGLVAFLPALPIPGAKIEISPDLVNCHHPDYYQGKRTKATDDENPVPNFFPAVEAGLIFEFVVAPVRRPIVGLPDGLPASAKEWLRTGLETRGAGAKTNAGYGWFEDAEEEFRQQQEAENKRQEELREQDRKRQEAEANRQRNEAEKVRLATMTPEQKADAVVGQWDSPTFLRKSENFFKEAKKGGPADDVERGAIVRLLREARISVWADLKQRGTKGDLATAVNAIRAHCKKMGLEKMP